MTRRVNHGICNFERSFSQLIAIQVASTRIAEVFKMLLLLSLRVNMLFTIVFFKCFWNFLKEQPTLYVLTEVLYEFIIKYQTPRLNNADNLPTQSVTFIILKKDYISGEWTRSYYQVYYIGVLSWSRKPFFPVSHQPA